MRRMTMEWRTVNRRVVIVTTPSSHSHRASYLCGDERSNDRTIQTMHLPHSLPVDGGAI